MKHLKTLSEWLDGRTLEDIPDAELGAFFEVSAVAMTASKQSREQVLQMCVQNLIDSLARTAARRGSRPRNFKVFYQSPGANPLLNRHRIAAKVQAYITGKREDYLLYVTTLAADAVNEASGAREAAKMANERLCEILRSMQVTGKRRKKRIDEWLDRWEEGYHA